MDIKNRILTEHTNGRTRDDLITAVLRHSIKGFSLTVVDVRENVAFPLDQRFNPKELRDALNDRDIQFLRFKQLGNPFHKEKEWDDVKKKIYEVY